MWLMNSDDIINGQRAGGGGNIKVNEMLHRTESIFMALVLALMSRKRNILERDGKKRNDLEK